MAARYGVDLSRPSATAREAVQAVYLAYLAGIKGEQRGRHLLGRTSTFLDIYLQRDLEAGVITEEEAQELIDQFIIKLRLVRHLRTPEYNELFGGDPTWVTEAIGGMSIDGRTLVTRTSFRYLHTPGQPGQRPRSPTSPCCGRSTSPPPSRPSVPKCPSSPTPSNTKMTT